MPRPIRIEFDGAIYHVTARGNERRDIYRDDRDRGHWLENVGEAVERFGLVVHAYCLMPNHYHLLLTTPRGNLSQAMGWLQTAYSVWFNRRHERSGHLFQGRFKAHLVSADEYARTLVRYIHLNPVRPKDHRRPVPAERREELRRYGWSSHRCYAGLAQGPEWLSLEWLSYWGKSAGAAKKAYARDVDGCFGEVIEQPWDQAKGGGLVLGEGLWERLKGMARGGDRPQEWMKRVGAETSRERAREMAAGQADARVALWMRARLGGEVMAELARELGYADGSGVLRVLQRLERRAEMDAGLRRKMKEAREGMEAMSRVKG